MPGTFSQIYVHIVIAVKGRQNILKESWRIQVFKYISGIINNKGQKSIIVNGVADHIHIFIGLKPAMAVSDLVRDIKNNSTNFINSKNWTRGKFSWQEGYGVFSYSKSQIEKVYEYIFNQEAHHKKRSFREEYMDLLNKFNVDYRDEYLFRWIE